MTLNIFEVLQNLCLKTNFDKIKMYIFATSRAYEGKLRTNLNVKTSTFFFLKRAQMILLNLGVKARMLHFENEDKCFTSLVGALECGCVGLFRFLFIILLLPHWGTIPRVRGCTKLAKDDRYLVIALRHADGLPRVLRH